MTFSQGLPLLRDWLCVVSGSICGVNPLVISRVVWVQDAGLRLVSPHQSPNSIRVSPVCGFQSTMRSEVHVGTCKPLRLQSQLSAKKYAFLWDLHMLQDVCSDCYLLPLTKIGSKLSTCVQSQVKFAEAAAMKNPQRRISKVSGNKEAS